MDESSPSLTATDNPEVSRERSDVDIRAITLFGIGLMILALVTCVLMWWLFNYFAAREQWADPPPASLVSGGLRDAVPPEPRLQVSPTQDMHEMQAAEDALLQNYGWVDPSAGTVRIPIERAMQLLAERGVPTRTQEEGRKGEEAKR